jgi:hypothetical protein
VAGAGLVLAFSAPCRPVHDVVDTGQRSEGEVARVYDETQARVVPTHSRLASATN